MVVCKTAASVEKMNSVYLIGFRKITDKTLTVLMGGGTAVKVSFVGRGQSVWETRKAGLTTQKKREWITGGSSVDAGRGGANNERRKQSVRSSE
jgi:ribosomal protein L13E